MTKIVKSVSVVEERGPGGPLPLTPPEPPRISGIIKRQVLAGQIPQAQARQRMPLKDEYIDELNRLQIEVRQAKEELRSLGREIDEAKNRDREEAERRELESLSVQDAEANAADIIDQAKAEAEEILKDAKAEGIQLAENAKNDGYLEGFSKGFEEAGLEFHREYDPKMVQIAEILDRLADYEAQVLRDQKKDLIELSMTVARKVLCRSLELDPAAVGDLLRGVVEENSREQYVKVTIAPDLMPLKAKASEELRALLTGLGANVTLAVDSDLEPGGATVETPKGVVDVSIATQLNNLKSAALGE